MNDRAKHESDRIGLNRARAESAPIVRAGWARCARFTLVATLALLALPLGARAQSPGLAGNQHPDAELIAHTDAANPFDPAPRAPTGTVDEKRAFAAAVDLAPLRDLAVSHSGRVKILDTLARDTIRDITGRRDYIDFRRAPDAVEGSVEAEDITKVHYDPLFTFLDLQIDPAYYAAKPLVHVEYLPLRVALLERAFPGEENAPTRERWKKVGRLSPVLLEANLMAVAREHEFDEPFRRGVSKAGTGLDLFAQSWQNLDVVAPSTEAAPWIHVSRLAPDHPASVALRGVIDAWRARDASRVNSSIVALVEALDAINPEMHPGARARVELAYNSVQPFEWGYWVYLLSLIALLLAFGTGRRWLTVTGVALLVAAVTFHGLGFAARCVIAERFAIQNQFESMMGLSLFATLVGLGILIIRRQPLFGAAAAGVGFMVLLTAQAGVPGMAIEREAAILNTSWLLKYHVTTVLSSYGLIALGMMCSLFYLLTYYAARVRGLIGPGAKGASTGGVGAADGGGSRGDGAPVFAGALGLDDDDQRGLQRVLGDLDRAQMVVLQLAFWALGVGILLGAWWADHSWGRWWAFDPKETWALLTWIVYLIVIHLRFSLTGPKRALTTAWLSIVGFIVMIFTYFGVNLLLPGLHAYA